MSPIPKDGAFGFSELALSFIDRNTHLLPAPMLPLSQMVSNQPQPQFCSTPCVFVETYPLLLNKLTPKRCDAPLKLKKTSGMSHTGRLTTSIKLTHPKATKMMFNRRQAKIPRTVTPDSSKKQNSLSSPDSLKNASSLFPPKTDSLKNQNCAQDTYLFPTLNCTCRRRCDAKKNCPCRKAGKVCSVECHPGHSCSNTIKRPAEDVVDLFNFRVADKKAKKNPTFWKEFDGIRFTKCVFQPRNGLTMLSSMLGRTCLRYSSQLSTVCKILSSLIKWQQTFPEENCSSHSHRWESLDHCVDSWV